MSLVWAYYSAAAAPNVVLPPVAKGLTLGVGILFGGVITGGVLFAAGLFFLALSLAFRPRPRWRALWFGLPCLAFAALLLGYTRV
ncbi:hypothetical protein UC35_17735 [Ramlibacter tataouinensis]|uniref:Uncharacterized protein n=1 Tax=Ramlibacter tataouinensis TaxID=94132 RepID=A0A127K0P0_9BURK|nr:hypothetical protein UC35_17735 [Ramlibacter tataouinensis]